MPDFQSSQEAMPQEPLSGPERPEVQGLKAKIKKIESQIEGEKSPEKKVEVAKEEIKSYLKELQQAPIASAPVATRDEAKEISRFPQGQQVEALISLVFEKGLMEGIKVAKELDNPSVLDEFHDALVDKYYNDLVAKGVFKFK